jgi:hypothetical protein
VVNDPTFPYRVAFGLTIFGVLGVIDVVRNPQNPKRLKEYAFLFGVTAIVMLFGLVHDAVTFSLSPDYFRVIKGIRSGSFFPDVAQLALAASWTVGLVIGLAFLVANNPSERWPQLPYRRLARHLLWPAVMAPLLAVFMAVATRLAPEWVAERLGSSALRADVATVWVAHIGTYVGAVSGLVAGVVQITRERRRGGRSRTRELARGGWTGLRGRAD